jgi:intracellular sulfur oxidation DsrE/DsrF family protein
MKNSDTYSDEFLNAFVDNELASDEKSQVYTRINSDEGLNRRVCELRKVRDLVHLSFSDVPQPERAPNRFARTRRWGIGAAAAVTLALGTVVGWVVHQPGTPAQSTAAGSQIPVAEGTATAETIKVVLHLNSGKYDRMKETLDEAEALLDYYDSIGQRARVEVIANGGGLNLLRADSTPFPERIKSLYQKHSNLVFVACQNTIDRLKAETGIVAKLVPEAVVIDSAVAQIMRRQQQGWAYIQV